jgi:lysophospholipase L1-like esterase
MRKRVSIAVVWMLMLVGALSTGAQDQRSERGVGTWATALVGRPQTPPAPAQAAPAAPGAPAAAPAPVPPPTFNNQTLRQIVHASVGGDRVRVTLSNVFGTAPLEIGAVSLALRDKESAIVERSAKRVTFSGNAAFTIPPGAVVLSDAVELQVPPFADLAIDVYVPGDVPGPVSLYTMHAGANQTSYVSATGNHTAMPAIPVMATTASWFLLARVEVAAAAPVATVVAFGDSITDGSRSTANTNNRWPDQLARRLAADRNAARVAVLNAGIAGNRVLSDGAAQTGVNALARFDRDVLLQPGVTHVVVMEGINDIGQARQNPSPAAADLIAAHRQLIERAHARGLRIYGATLTPFEGAAYWTSEGEAKRATLNEWIRTARAYDGVIDFDAAVRDPGAPTKILPQYDSGDHLHPNDAGYQAMGNAVDLSLFRSGAAPATR